MDVQNAAESEQMRLSGASPSHLPSDPELDVKARPPASLTAPSSPREPRIHAGDGTDNPTGAAPSAVRPEDLLPVADRDSDAETIVLPGKDGHSPSKARKVRQEDRSDSDGEPVKTRPQSVETDGTAAPASAPTVALGYQLADNTGKKRAAQPSDKPRQPRAKEILSSGLSSAPESPPPTRREPQHQNHQQQCRRPSDATRSSSSDGEQQSFQKTSLPKLPSSVRDKVKSTERTLPHKRKDPITESDDEADIRKASRQRTSSANPDGPRPPKDVKSTPARPPSDALARSVSPQSRQHRRRISSILPSQSNGTSVQKKRLPPLLQPTDYHSDDSSVSGSPHPRSSKLRSLATPATADSIMYPAKMAPHKKHLDAHGQTLLARACARGEYVTAMLRLAERPEDLNFADYAGNTPLQIASLHGSEDIVQLLIDAGCNLDCVNYDKDTPLLDAVDNGHVGVVRLLLDAGVNPRKANVSGQEPLDRVSDETNNAEEIRAALVAARKRAGERRRTSEDRHSHPDHQDVRDSHAPESPRRSAQVTASTSTGRRSGTVRSTKTRNDLLYMPLDDKTLRQAAGRGDKETVARILQVKEAFDDPESMVAAARGGHDLVIQLLLGLGGANPDPGPVPSLSSDFATPILAAIGQENIKVIELLLEQQGFDPTRRFKGDTYYEIAHRRQGTNWKEEEQMLKNAYDDYRRAHKDNLKVKSPQGLRERERDTDDKPPKQDEVRDPSRSHRRNHESPSHDDARKKRPAGSKTGSPREKKRPYLPLTRTRDEAQTRIPGRARKDPPAHASDREVSPVLPPKPLKSMRAESDLAGLSSEGETAKPRRKLVSKGELSKERDRKRATQEPASPREPRSEDVTDKTKSSDKYNSRTKGTKRDEREHTSSDVAIKRQRMSTKPDRLSDADKDLLEGSTKRRRLDAEIKLAKRLNRPPCIEERNRKPVSSRHRQTKAAAAGSRKEREGGPKEVTEHRKPLQHGQNRSNNNAGDRSIHVKSEDVDVLMHDLGPHGETEKPDSAATEQTEEEPLRNRELGEEANCEEEWRNIDDEEKKRKQEEEDFRRQQEEEEKARRAEEERNKREEEEARKRRELADRERREAEEAARRQAEEKKLLEEERRRKEEKEQKKRDDEERLRKEQLAREAAEEARRQREEEERKERERRDRAHREEVERKRAAREAEQKRIREEQERARLDKLPPLLRWLDLCPNPKTSTIAEKFRRMVGARYDTIRQEANGTPAGREQWILNIHVALLLGEKDLDLSRYTAWERELASNLAKLTIWRTEWACYALLSEQVWDLGRQLPGYYGVADPSEMDQGTRQRLKEAAWDRFLAMDLFFVKVSDFMYTVPNIPHLRNIKLAVEYRELLETEAQLVGWRSSSKWKQDPGVERFFGFAPRHTYYVNGVFTGEEIPTRSETSKTPFPEVRVPRRGFVRAYPTDPDYERLCIEQGLEQLITGPQTPTLINGVHSSPPCQNSPLVNGTRGSASHDATDGEVTTNGVNMNGVNSL